MRIREAVPADAWAIARVHVASWQSTYRGLLPDTFLDDLVPERRATFWQAELANPDPDESVFVVEDDQCLIYGFASCGPERSGNSAYRGELYAIYLLESYQRQGTGRQLVSTVAGRLLQKGLSSMLVWVLSENPARRFYEALGGVYVSAKTLRIADVDLQEVSYGWQDILPLIQTADPEP